MTTSPLLACLALCMLSLQEVLAYDCGKCDCIHYPDTLVIDCTNKGLDEIPVFDNLVPASIVGLEFSGNRLTTLFNNSLSGLTNLTGVNFSNNTITSIEVNAFAGQDNTLSRLELGNNELTHDQLARINIDLLTSLTELNLHNNRITALSDNQFSLLTQLKKLTLNGNQISAIFNTALNGLSGSLEEIDLSSNQMTSLPGIMFWEFSKLKKVFITGNGLTDIAATAFPQNAITVLHLQNNQLDQGVFLALDNQRRMDDLDLSNNRISKVNSIAFEDMALMTNLDLSNNSIEEISIGAFPTSTPLVLNLQNNLIPDSSLQALPSRTLRELYLENNKLTTVPETKFINQERLDTIHLKENPIVCNCSVVWMQSSDWKTTYDDWTCAEPPALAGKIFKTIASETICPPNDSAGMTRYYLGMMIGAVGVALGIIL